MRLSRPIVALLAACLVLISAAPGYAADPLADAARRLTVEIGAKSGNEMGLTMTNLSSVAEGPFTALRGAIEAQLRAAGVKVVAASATQTRITLSENARGYLWVAEIRKGDAQQVAIEPVARDEVAPPLNAVTFTLRKTLLWAQHEPILDTAQININGAARLLVLEPGRVAMYAVQGPRGELLEAQPIVRTTPLPRDVRGRLVLGQDHLFDAFLPGMHCTAKSVPEMTCVATDDPWPLDLNLKAFFAASRNFFTGVLSGAEARGKSTAPFYSAAKLDEQGAPLWLFAGVDGQVRVFDGTSESAVEYPDWGSDIAAVKSACGSRTQLLVTRPADDNSPDAVRAYETAARLPVAVSQPLEFAGSITALWPAPGAAIAVSHNLKTGSYEAFSLTVDCQR